MCWAVLLPIFRFFQILALCRQTSLNHDTNVGRKRYPEAVNLQCVWQVVAPEGLFLLITFTRFDTFQNDYVAFTRGTFQNAYVAFTRWTFSLYNVIYTWCFIIKFCLICVASTRGVIPFVITAFEKKTFIMHFRCLWLHLHMKLLLHNFVLLTWFIVRLQKPFCGAFMFWKFKFWEQLGT